MAASTTAMMPTDYATAGAAASAEIATTVRDFVCIDLSDFDNRRDEIVSDLARACKNEGFFYGRPAKERRLE